jgi:hypothetical protein
VMRHQGLKRRGVVPGDKPLKQLRIGEAGDSSICEQVFDVPQCCAERFDGRFSRSFLIVASLFKRPDRRLGRHLFWGRHAKIESYTESGDWAGLTTVATWTRRLHLSQFHRLHYDEDGSQ